MKLYSINGEEIDTLVKGNVPSGQHELEWNAGNMASGVYLFSMRTNGFFETKKMIYQK